MSIEAILEDLSQNIDYLPEDTLMKSIIKETRVIGNILEICPIDLFSYSLFRIEMGIYAIKELLETDYGLKLRFLRKYDGKRILLYWETKMSDQVYMNFEIPYHEREKYIQFIYEVNQLIEVDGLVCLSVNNLVYQQLQEWLL